jgi:hypothetical protein
MAAERTPQRRRGRPAIDWNGAFLHFAALPPERRSYAAVAAEFAVSVRTVERHGLAERWRERALELDRDALASAAERIVEQRAARLSDLEKLVEASLVGYAQKLREGKVRLGPRRPAAPVQAPARALAGAGTAARSDAAAANARRARAARAQAAGAAGPVRGGRARARAARTGRCRS